MIATPEFVYSIVTHPDVWPWLAEDTDKPGDYWPAEATYYRHGDHGFMEFRQTGAHWQQVHIAMLRGARGVPEFVRECMADQRACGVTRFSAWIPEINHAAIRLAYRCGYEYEGRMRKVLLKRGRMVDMVMLGAD